MALYLRVFAFSCSISIIPPESRLQGELNGGNYIFLSELNEGNKINGWFFVLKMAGKFSLELAEN